MCTGGSSTLDLLDLSHLRYRERDALEEVFKSYSRKFACDMTSLREHRMRGYYEERYDARRALGDWDYQYTLRETIASIIHITLYRDWREKGVAFEFGDQTYEEGNRTMMTYVEGAMKRGKNAGDHKEIRGFWGDIVASPYFAFGVDADSSSPPLSATAASYADGLFEILNKGTGSEQHRHHAVEVAVYNMFCMLWEVEMGTPYTMLKKNDIFSGLGQLDKEQVVSRPAELDPQVESAENGEDLPVVEELFDIAEEGDDECHDGNEEKGDGAANILHPTAAIDPAGGGDVDGNAVQAAMEEEEFVKELRRAECIVETFQGARVFPLTGGSAQEILKKEKYRSMFDGVFISNRSAQFVNDPLINTILKDTIDGKKCLVAVETAKYCIPLLRNQRKEFNVKLKEYGISQGWNHCITPPVRRRRRDSADDMDDVMFFVKSAEDCSAATSEEA
ncbi:Dnaaf3 [Symbiodinium microadriaticum]|nr:Dnaaf3 [Symbiodinium microadriaticum]